MCVPNINQWPHWGPGAKFPREIFEISLYLNARKTHFPDTKIFSGQKCLAEMSQNQSKIRKQSQYPKIRKISPCLNPEIVLVMHYWGSDVPCSHCFMTCSLLPTPKIWPQWILPAPGLFLLPELSEITMALNNSRKFFFFKNRPISLF